MKALVLFSGGLDSTLALTLMQRLGIETLPVSFLLPFRRMEEVTNGKQPAGLRILPLEEDYLDMLKAPRHGRGKHLNPCIDCHLFMLRKAKALMPENGADFVVTGEVLGQRPMSQHRPSLNLIERESGLAGLLLRPLSAQLLDPTLPEERGWVPREKLLAIRGRSRKIQYELAQAWGVDSFDSPAGGCLMTDQSYCRKLENIMASGMLSLDTMRWIRFGRFFDLAPDCKLMVARNEKECEALQSLAQPGDRLLSLREVPGPTAALRGRCTDSLLQTAASVLAGYCRHGEKPVIEAQEAGRSEVSAVDYAPGDSAATRERMII